jgi:hypothetical protein
LLSRTVAALGLIVATGMRSAAADEKPWQFPTALQPAMESRLREFTAAQKDGRWNDVDRLLGAYRRGFSGYLAYTPQHKACFVSQLQAFPIITFTFSIQESPFSSEILTTPPERRWWTLVGDAGIRRPSGEVVQQRSVIVAYRDGKDWFFTPFHINDDAWARAHLSADEIAADQRDRVALVLHPGCPLDFVDLHVFTNPDRLSVRHVEFRLRNKTDKAVTGYSFEVGEEEHRGSISVGTGAPRDAIAPRGLSRKWEEDDTAYLYWCEGASHMRIEIQSVTFSDGSTWNAPGFPPKEEDSIK